MRALRRVILVLFAVPLLGAGCISFRSSSGSDGGLYLTKDRGEQWTQRGAIPSVTATRGSLANDNITVIVQDPSDRNAMYAGTDVRGGFYSWDAGNTWWPLGAPFASARVSAIAVDPRAKCTIYVASGARIFKTTDCTRSWRSSDFETTVSAAAVDPTNPAIIYAGNTKGDILRSTDGGSSWRAIHRIESRIRTITIGGNARGAAVYVGTATAGMYRSTDQGTTWTDLRKGMEQYPAAFDFKALVASPEQPGLLTYASKYGILRSTDSGATWQPFALLTAAGAVDIYALGVHPKSPQEIVYATATTFYKSADSGKSWVSKKLPTTRAASVLNVDAADGNTIWMGTLKLAK